MKKKAEKNGISIATLIEYSLNVAGILLFSWLVASAKIDSSDGPKALKMVERLSEMKEPKEGLLSSELLYQIKDLQEKQKQLEKEIWALKNPKEAACQKTAEDSWTLYKMAPFHYYRGF